MEVEIGDTDFRGLFHLSVKTNKVDVIDVDHPNIRWLSLGDNSCTEFRIDAEKFRVLDVSSTSLSTFPEISTPELKRFNGSRTYFEEIDEEDIPTKNLEELLLYARTVDIIYPTIFNRIIEVAKVYLGFAESNTSEMKEIATKIETWHRGKKVYLNQLIDNELEWKITGPN